MTCEGERTRLVVLGGPGVGKSAIVNKFLYNTFTEKYRTTVEDLHSRTFHLGQISLKVDILDTCGDLQFPAMRRLSIATAHAFLLVYSVTSEESLSSVQRCFEEVREQRPDYQEVPIVLAGNKLDLADGQREVPLEDVSEWLYCTLPKLRTKLLECSAKTGLNIQEIFKTFVTLAKLLPSTTDDSTPLKRRSSAYGSRRGGSPASTSSGAGTSAQAASPKPRSRSLIRRSSRKTKQHLSDSNADSTDCIIS
ncbi:GTP-binding protein Di-Ras2 isoform X2 [Cimex lectularius]|uniref:GTP-binding protein Di-Ras2 n=1 Tax=Cimex lectularius TaxID=79782 RepID=A0A8I6S7X9_CIMLE|nr:GTP-binding protein Di-Ras2 isoform X2 [Cimex lectularius]